MEDILKQYRELNLETVVDFKKFNQYVITHHSTAIEGSTLTETETQLLLDEGITPKGKPLLHSLMVEDHYKALLMVIGEAKKKAPISLAFIQSINACVMKNTGNLYNTPFGPVDASKGEFRKGNVRAGNSYFVNFDKVPRYTTTLVERLQKQMKEVSGDNEMLELSFSAHFDLVTIHPFYDGNGRTSRLLMNFLQQYFGLPLAIVFKEDKQEYFDALIATRKQEKMEPFYQFMHGQYKKLLLSEIDNYVNSGKLEPKRNKNKGLSLFF